MVSSCRILLHCLVSAAVSLKTVAPVEYIVGKHSTNVNVKTGTYLLPQYDSIVSRYLSYFGEWEQPFQDALRSLIEASDEWDLTHNRTTNHIYFDIGANIGAWAVPMGRYFQEKGGHTYAFEPVQETYFYLCSNLVINGITNITAINKAVGKKSGTTETPILRPASAQIQNLGAVSLMMYERNEERKKQLGEKSPPIFHNLGEQKASSRLTAAGAASTNATVVSKTSNSDTHPTSSSSTTVDVEGDSAAIEATEETSKLTIDDNNDDKAAELPATRSTAVVSLDEMFNAGELPCPGFIKMDTELYELYILQGGLDMIKSCKPILFLEMDCRALTKSVVLLLYSMGYALAWTVLPVIYLDDRSFEGRSWKNLSTPLLRGIVETSPASITAVFGSKAQHLFFQRPEARSVFYPIIIAQGALYLEDYNVRACLPLPGDNNNNNCIHMRQLPLGSHCGGYEMLPEDIGYSDDIADKLADTFPLFAAAMDRENNRTTSLH